MYRPGHQSLFKGFLNSCVGIKIIIMWAENKPFLANRKNIHVVRIIKKKEEEIYHLHPTEFNSYVWAGASKCILRLFNKFRKKCTSSERNILSERKEQFPSRVFFFRKADLFMIT